MEKNKRKNMYICFVLLRWLILTAPVCDFTHVVQIQSHARYLRLYVKKINKLSMVKMFRVATITLV